MNNKNFNEIDFLHLLYYPDEPRNHGKGADFWIVSDTKFSNFL
ncbi:MAG: hypothetical protein RL728_951 [Bacteroidota bacterium]|jgi:hypothetical protein